MRNADPTSAVPALPTRVCTMQFMRQAADSGLHIALLTGGKIEQTAQRALLQVDGVGLLRSKLFLTLLHRFEQFREPLYDVIGLGLELLDQILVYIHLMQVVDQVLQLSSRDVNRQFLTIAQGRDSAWLEDVAGTAHLYLVRDTVEYLLKRTRLAIEHKLLGKERQAQLIGVTMQIF